MFKKKIIGNFFDMEIAHFFKSFHLFLNYGFTPSYSDFTRLN